MKRFLMAISLIAVTSAGLVSGCSTKSANNTANASTNAPVTNPFDASNTTTTNSTGGDADTSMTDAQMTDVVKQVINRYIASHNDKTQQDYAADIQQLLIPGLASAVASSASSGVDYNHPVKSSTVNISDVQAVNKEEIHGVATCNITYADGKLDKVVYHVMLSPDANNPGQWLIRSIG